MKTKTEKGSFFPRISYEDFVEVIQVWNKETNLLAEVVHHDDIPEKLTFKNLQTLSGSTWLNDEVALI